MSGMQSNIGGIGARSIKQTHIALNAVSYFEMAQPAVNTGRLYTGVVNQARLSTELGSAAGTLGAGLAVSFAMNAYSFSPDISIETASNTIEAAASGPSQVDSPRVRLRNNDSVTRAYQAAWRYVSTVGF